MATNKKNLAAGIVANFPGISGTDIILETGYGATMPIPPFYITLTPTGQLSTLGNSEIVLVNYRSGDTLTVVRAQKGTTAKDIQAGWTAVNSVYTDDIILPAQIDWQAFKAEKTSTQATVSNNALTVISWQDVGEFLNRTNFNVSDNSWTAPSNGWFEGGVTLNVEGGTGNDDTMSWGLTKNGSWATNISDNWRYFSRGGVEYPSTIVYGFAVSSGDKIQCQYSGTSYSVNLLSTGRWVGRFYPYN